MPASIDTIQSVLLVIDASDSAAPHWSEIKQAGQHVIQVLPDGAIDCVYLLGSPHAVECEKVSNLIFPARSGPSLIAPIITKLREERRRVQVGIIIGTGEVFDLEDYLWSPWVNHWALVNASDFSLAPAGLYVPEFSTKNLDILYEYLDNGSFSPSAVQKRFASVWSSENYELEFDRAGFPLIYIESLHSWIHLFPVAKPQFETFLSETSHFDDEWYQQILSVGPRCSFRNQEASSYEDLFLTGILFQEILPFADWLGPEYRLLSVSEWREAYRCMEKRAIFSPPANAEHAGLAESAKGIWQQVLELTNPSSLLEQSLMEHGVIEWLAEGGIPAGGLGHPRSSFKSILYHPLTDEPRRPISHAMRLRHYGFRLIRKESL